MTVPVSTVPTVKAWLLGRLTSQITQAPGASMAVVYGDPGTNQPDDLIQINTGNRELLPGSLVGSLDQGSLREKYTIDVTVRVYRGGAQSFQTAEERLWAIVAVIERVFRTDMWALIAGDAAVRSATLGGAVWSLSIEPHDLTEEWAPSGLGPSVSLVYPVTIYSDL